MTNYIKGLERSVDRFNEVVGRYDDVTANDIAEQFKLVTEEMAELQESLDNQDLGNTYKEVADVFYTLMGFTRLTDKALEQRGKKPIRLERVMAATCESNESKLHANLDEKNTAWVHDKYKDKDVLIRHKQKGKYAWFYDEKTGKVLKHGKIKEVRVL